MQNATFLSEALVLRQVLFVEYSYVTGLLAPRQLSCFAFRYVMPLVTHVIAFDVLIYVWTPDDDGASVTPGEIP